MILSVDQLGNRLEFSTYPQRIVSLVPSQTELLYDLGLDNRVIGITKFCVRPNEWFITKQKVGGTKTVNLEKVISLKPDLIIANKEENVQEQIEALREIAPVWVSDIETLEDALSMITSIGDLVNAELRAYELAKAIQLSFDQLTKINPSINAAYLIWKDPYMAPGSGTFINDMMNCIGFKNIFEAESRYPTISIDQLSSLDCELLLLSSEPYPFKQKHVDELKQQLPKATIVLVDGEMFSWYGSRLLHASEYFDNLLREILFLKHKLLYEDGQ